MIIPDDMISHIGKIFSGEYLINYVNEDPSFTILDIGANIGGFARWASYVWPNAQIDCYEPVSFNYNLLVKNMQDKPNVKCHNVAVGAEEAEKFIFYGKNNVGECSFYLGDEQVNNGENVKIISATILPVAKIVKIDTEGSEVEIIKNIQFKPDVYLIEYHSSKNKDFIESYLTDYVLIEHTITGADYGILKYGLKELISIEDSELIDIIDNEKKSLPEDNDLNNIKVSVVLTSYNNPLFLRRAIDSVLNQTYSNFELIIADDNSSDPDVLNILEEYKDHEKVIFFNSNIQEEDRLKTARYATQINTAVTKYSSGNYICYLADDDYFYPKMLEKMVEDIVEYNHDVIFCAQHIKDVNDNIDGGGVRGKGIRFFKEPLIRGADKLDHNQVMTSRKAFNTVDGWDDNPICWAGADAYFFDRLENAGYRFYPIRYWKPLQAKMYREHSIQWNMANNLSPVEKGNN